ncbi:hypothetical protein AAA081_08835, partial [Aedoeadaptatus acetigenes]
KESSGRQRPFTVDTLRKVSKKVLPFHHSRTNRNALAPSPGLKAIKEHILSEVENTTKFCPLRI